MSTKITDMTSATEMGNADILPIVQGGANFSVTKELVLTGGAGEDIVIQGSSGQVAALQVDSGLGGVGINDSGLVTIQAGGGMIVQDASTLAQFTVDTLGNWNMTTGTVARVITFGGGGTTFLTLDMATEKITFQGSGGSAIAYVPGNAGDWDVPSPPDLTVAMDRLSAAVVGLLAGPIP